MLEDDGPALGRREVERENKSGILNINCSDSHD